MEKRFKNPNCEFLKKLRNQLALINDIEFKSTPCTFEGECLGTCPQCDAEIQQLETLLQEKINRGEIINYGNFPITRLITRIPEHKPSNFDTYDSHALTGMPAYREPTPPKKKKSSFIDRILRKFRSEYFLKSSD